MTKDSNSTNEEVRVDKWLWAARFFKTRAIAKQAIETGKVTIDGNRVKPSREMSVGMTLCIRQSWDEKTVVVQALSGQRKGAPEAALLYEETQQSLEKRDEQVENRRLQALLLQPTAKPDKKDRRKRSELKHRSE